MSTQSMTSKTGVLLVNLGTPDSPTAWSVFRYLNQFLTDGRVIDIPWLWRQLLVRGVIVPRRFRMSAAMYRKIWTDEGSPLMVYSKQVVERLQEELGDDFVVALGMRYQNPSIEAALNFLKEQEPQHLVIIPMFPQYASATTGSIHQCVMEKLSQWNVIPATTFVNSYATHPLYIDAFADRGRSCDLASFDKVMFSFHGLPERQLRKADRHGKCLSAPGCCERLTAQNTHCYRAQCYSTARALAEKLDLTKEDYVVTFQSRLGNEPWTQPYTDTMVEELAEKGVKRLVVFAPAFTTDCLETLEEIGQEYSKLFQKCGGEKLQLVESLNVHPTWVQALRSIVLENCRVVREPVESRASSGRHVLQHHS